MSKHRAAKGKKIKWAFIITVVIFLAAILVIGSLIIQRNVLNPEEIVTVFQTIDEDYLEKSILNGQAFLEEHEYNEADDKKLHYAYVTVLPTLDSKTDSKVTLSDLNSVTGMDKNPVVEVMFQQGNKEGPIAEIYDSSVLRPNGTMKIRGFSSRKPSQKSYKIKLNGVADKFLGQDKLNLNKHFADPLRISNKFCLDAFEDITDIGSLETYFVKLYIRDLSKGIDTGFVDYGLFTMVEQPNKDYLRSHNLDKNGSLYKAIDFSFADSQSAIVSEDDPYYDKKAFESILEVRENADHDKVVDMITAINDSSNSISDVVSTYFNRDNYLTWMATNIIFGNIDATANNFLLYSAINSKTWYFIPWDYDKTLLFTKREIEIYGGFPKKLYGLGNFWGITLHNRFFKDPKNIEDLNNRIDEIMETNLSYEKCKELTSSYRPVLEEAAFVVPDLAKLLIPADEMIYYTDNVYDILKYYVDLYYANLERPMPVFMSAVEIDKNNYLFAWDQAYDLQGDTVFYTLEIARDLDFENIIYSTNKLIETTHKVQLKLESDTYYYKVSMIDSSGNEQINLESYQDPVSGDEYMAMLAFEVD